MNTVNSIREDLKNIKYYYSRKAVFDKVVNYVGESEFTKKIELYNTAIKLASPRLYDLYISLYLGNETQESLADKLGYASEYISRLNSQLVRFFLKEFKKEESYENWEIR